MALFVLTAAFFCLPVLAKATGMSLFAYGCGSIHSTSFSRLSVPVAAVVIGYLIFVLEGAQSSVILANRQTTETLLITLANLDISKSVQQRTVHTLEAALDHHPIDDFIVGRQVLIFILAFAFKKVFDQSSLTLSEVHALLAAKTACPITSGMALTAYGLLDNEIFSSVIGAVLIAFAMQVPAKLMAQGHPMRFVATMPLAMRLIAVSRYVGKFSLLDQPLAALHRYGERRHRDGKPSIFYGKEYAPVDSQQAFETFAARMGECVTDLVVYLRPSTGHDHPMWDAHLLATYQVMEAGSIFAHMIHLRKREDMEDVTFEAAAFFDGVEMPFPPADLKMTPLRTVRESSRPEEFDVNLIAIFNSELPVGTKIEWIADYFMPITEQDDVTRTFKQKVFEIPITKAVRRVSVYVEASDVRTPMLVIQSINGVQTPKYRPMHQGRQDGWHFMIVDYPSMGSRLQFRF